MDDRSFHELYKQYETNTEEKNEIQKLIDEKTLLDNDKIKKHYQSYPDYNDENFTKQISEKAEFFIHKNNLNIKKLHEKCDSLHFQLENHQTFLKNFMNPHTPYKSLLVFHGVGVGKTCTAVSISQNFKNMYKDKNKKIICLVSKNIKPGWMKTIYDPEKGTDQCTGDEFSQYISNEGFHQEVGTKKKVKKLIKEYYEFYGYHEFSNYVKKLVKIRLGKRSENLREFITKEVIEDIFSDRLLIIDEIHNIRSDNSKFTTDTIQNIKKVIKYSKNLRLIGLSATPMFNQSTEIVELLNMFLMNDNRPLIQEKDLFTPDGQFKPEGEELLIKKSRGYISYLRGENPITFPLRLYPDFNKDESCYKPKLIKDIHNQSYEYDFTFLQLYSNKFVGFQRLAYLQFLKKLNKSGEIKLDERGIGLQLSNIVYPYSTMKPPNKIKWSEMYGNRGLMNTMNQPVRKNKKLVYSYKQEILDKYGPIFQLKNLKTFSIKLFTILQGFIHHNSEGIIFIYSNYVKSGILPIAFALEELGIENITGNILDKKHKTPKLDYRFREKKDVHDEFIPAKYSIICGDKDISLNNQAEITKATHGNNKDGKEIKIIIGNVVISEGIDLKNIREIHILDPWYHLNKIEQIIGRGVRYCSHKMLEPEKRNVTVYLHTGNEKNDKESIDTNTYKIAEKKAIQISYVEQLLKKNSIDCYLNYSVNLIEKNEIHNRKVISSHNKEIKNFQVHDKPYSKICSFSDKCNYKCLGDSIKETNINYDTFFINESFTHIKEIIIELFELHYYYTIEQIQSYINETINTNNSYIYETLQSMLDDETPVWYNHKCGYIVYKYNYYLFQPYSINDDTIPLFYRINEIHKHKPNDILIEDSLFTYDMININYNYDDIIKLFTNITKFILHEEIIIDGVVKKFKEISSELFTIKKKDIYIEFMIDQLPFHFKKILLMELILKTNTKKKKSYKELTKPVIKLYKKDIETIVINYFQNNIIYEDNELFLDINKTKKKKIGFYLNNNDHYEYFIYENNIWKSGDDILVHIKDIVKKQNMFLQQHRELILKNKKPFISGYSWWNTRLNEPSFKYIPSKSINLGKELKSFNDHKKDFIELFKGIDYKKYSRYIIKNSKLFRFLFEIYVRKHPDIVFYNYDIYLLFKI